MEILYSKVTPISLGWFILVTASTAIFMMYEITFIVVFQVSLYPLYREGPKYGPYTGSKNGPHHFVQFKGSINYMLLVIEKTGHIKLAYVFHTQLGRY